MNNFPRNKSDCRTALILTALLLAGTATVFTTGCSSFRTEWGAPLPQNARQYEKGKARVEEIVQELGPPAKATSLPGGFAFLYEHSRVREFQLGISFNAPILRWFKFIRASNRLEQDILLMVFDDEGVLLSVDSEEWRDSLGGGGAAQFLYSTMSLTDDSALRQRSPQHTWGRDDLQRLPVLLNSQQSLRSGEHGLQQRLAPLMAGQTTLEMPTSKPLKNKRAKRLSLE